MTTTTMWRATVTIRPKRGLRDPDGATIQEALHALGYADVENVHVGRTIAFDLAAGDTDDARVRAAQMCEKILANPVIEDFDIEVAGV